MTRATLTSHGALAPRAAVVGGFVSLLLVVLHTGDEAFRGGMATWLVILVAVAVALMQQTVP